MKLQKITSKVSLYELLKRPEVTMKHIEKILNEKIDKKAGEQIEIEIKYKGYINKTKKEIEKMLKLENKKIPADINYENVRNIATEAKQKLEKIRPITIGQATRISGVNTADISMLLVYLKKEYPNE